MYRCALSERRPVQLLLTAVGTTHGIRQIHGHWPVCTMRIKRHTWYLMRNLTAPAASADLSTPVWCGRVAATMCATKETLTQSSTRRLYCVEWHNTVFARSGPLSVHKLFTSCIRRCLVSRACEFLRLSDISDVICRVTYFQFLIQSAFLPYIGRQAAPALRHTIGFNTQYRTSHVAENLRKYVSCTENRAQWKDLELILAVEMESKHPVENQFGGKFPAICNRCGVMAAGSRKTWKLCKQLLRFFWKKMTPYGKIFQIIFWKFSPPHRSTLLCSNVVKFVRREIS